MFSLLEFYTASPHLILCGQPHSGKSTFLKHLKLKNKADVAQSENSAGIPINYDAEYSFYVREEESLDKLMQHTTTQALAQNPSSVAALKEVYLVFVDASTIATSSVAHKLKQWIADMKQFSEKDSKSRANRIFIAVSHLDKDDAIAIDDIDEALGSQHIKKLLCNCTFPNYDKQVDVIVGEIGEATGAKNTLLKEAFQSTSELRGKLSDRAHLTSQWLTKQSTELADTVSQILSSDDTRLARILIMGVDGQEKARLFGSLTGVEEALDSSSWSETIMDIVRDFSGFSFKLYHLQSESNLSETSLDFLATSNAFIYVVSKDQPLDAQRKYYQECWSQVDKSKVPSLIVVQQGEEAEGLVERITEEWNVATTASGGDATSSGQFICTSQKDQIEEGIAKLCQFVTQRQHIKTRESNILAHLFESLPDVNFEGGLNQSVEWTLKQQEAISRQLEGVLSSVTGSVQEYTPQIQETLGKATETVTESAKMVTNAVSSYWNSWWGGSNEDGSGEGNNQ